MATQSSKKRRTKKGKVLFSGDGIRDQMKGALPKASDLVDIDPGSKDELLKHLKAPDAGFQQNQCKDGEHQRESEVQTATPGPITSNSGKKPKKKHKKKASAVNPHSDVPGASEPSPVPNEDKSFTFEEQVEWCIGQLELGLHRHDATKAQKESNEKNIRTLRSLKVPMPRKRQLMRSLFGDYRSKMMATPLPETGTRAKEPCVSVVERKVAEDCGRFFKHKRSSTALMNSTEGYNGHIEEQEQFRFNFEINS